MTAPVPTNINIKADTEGNVVVTFAFPDGGTIATKFPSADAGRLASQFLEAAYHASVTLKDLPRAKIESQKDLPILAVTSLGSGTLNRREVMFVAMGNTYIALGVDEVKLADLSHDMQRRFWEIENDQPLSALFRSVRRVIALNAKGLIAVAGKRTRLLCQRYWRAAFNTITGRCIRIFREITLDPDYGKHPYDAANRCIYCGTDIYSSKPGVRRAPLGGEHIVPQGLVGTSELPKASCQSCEEITGARVEGDVLGLTMRAFRIYYDMHSGKRPTPRTLPLQDAGANPPRMVDVEVADYPIFLWMPVLDTPAIFSGASVEAPMPLASVIATVSFDPQKLARKYGVTTHNTARMDMHMFYRMLAKIGHALASAEMPGKFKPALTDLILTGAGAFDHIGGEPHHPETAKSTALHELALGFWRKGKTDYLVVRIRLLARFNGPTYYVVVGESLETSMARLRRFFSLRSSRTLSR